MTQPVRAEFELGRRFLARLPHGKDLIASIEDFCKESAIRTATFSVIGTVSSATIGAYDQKQQVYVTFTENTSMEILSCVGNVSLKDEALVIHAHVVLGSDRGKIIGGHLFSETVLFEGEMDLQELIGPPLKRNYDPATGLFQWSAAP